MDFALLFQGQDTLAALEGVSVPAIAVFLLFREIAALLVKLWPKKAPPQSSSHLRLESLQRDISAALKIHSAANAKEFLELRANQIRIETMIRDCIRDQQNRKQ